jgi:NAD(P)-dependent dehydrogenase (short-subunit alcohol dehydrogenase family)
LAARSHRVTAGPTSAQDAAVGRSGRAAETGGFSHPERLGEPVELRPFRAYGKTKNMTAMLARRLAGTNSTVNAAHPGIIAGTGLSTELPEISAIVARTYRIDPVDLPGPDVGADTPAWLATTPELDGVTGRFFVDRRTVDTAEHTTDPARCTRLWTETARLVDLPA